MFYGPVLYLTHNDNVIVAFSQLLSSSLWVLIVPALRAPSTSNKFLMLKLLLNSLSRNCFPLFNLYSTLSSLNLLLHTFPLPDVCLIRMCDAEFHYTYEYQGNAAKLVHTPLTDKCYLTLTQGMHMGLGGNPYGPAGTGKTESVKALGGLFGRQVLVFNCDEVVVENILRRNICL